MRTRFSLLGYYCHMTNECVIVHVLFSDANYLYTYRFIRMNQIPAFNKKSFTSRRSQLPFIYKQLHVSVVYDHNRAINTIF
jgi:hypothetical protein